MASGDDFPSKLSGLPQTKIIEENIDTVRNLVRKAQLFHFPSNFQLPTPFQS